MSSLYIEEKNFDRARKKIREGKEKKIIFSSEDDDLNRKILEKENINVLLLKQKGKKDRQKQRDSGFNSVMAKIAKKKNVRIGILLDEIIESRGRERAEIISRINQNVRICNKEKLGMIFVVFNDKYKKDDYNLKSLGLVLGMPTWMIKDL